MKLNTLNILEMPSQHTTAQHDVLSHFKTSNKQIKNKCFCRILSFVPCPTWSHWEKVYLTCSGSLTGIKPGPLCWSCHVIPLCRQSVVSPHKINNSLIVTCIQFDCTSLFKVWNQLLGWQHDGKKYGKLNVMSNMPKAIVCSCQKEREDVTWHHSHFVNDAVFVATWTSKIFKSVIIEAKRLHILYI